MTIGNKPRYVSKFIQEGRRIRDWESGLERQSWVDHGDLVEILELPDLAADVDALATAATEERHDIPSTNGVRPVEKEEEPYDGEVITYPDWHGGLELEWNFHERLVEEVRKQNKKYDPANSSGTRTPAGIFLKVLDIDSLADTIMVFKTLSIAQHLANNMPAMHRTGGSSLAARIDELLDRSGVHIKNSSRLKRNFGLAYRAITTTYPQTQAYHSEAGMRQLTDILPQVTNNPHAAYLAVPSTSLQRKAVRKTQHLVECEAFREPRDLATYLQSIPRDIRESDYFGIEMGITLARLHHNLGANPDNDVFQEMFEDEVVSAFSLYSPKVSTHFGLLQGEISDVSVELPATEQAQHHYVHRSARIKHRPKDRTNVNYRGQIEVDNSNRILSPAPVPESFRPEEQLYPADPGFTF